jgi:uracil-DNA glycosylase family 4
VQAIFDAARACRLCPSVVPGSAVLGVANGPAPCDILMLGEAPGRLGAGRTGVPFSGDESGRRFELLLAEAGLTRADVFVSNAILCLPLDAAGRNRRPSAPELANCGTHLEATLAAVHARLVVPLGATALAALERIEVHGLTLATAVATPHPWRGATLFPLYHPGRQAQLHRPWPQQLTDWRALAAAATQ